MGSCATVIEIILALVFPPLAVFLATGCGFDLLINILLTLLGFVPGMIHALFVVASTNDRRRTAL